LISLPDLLVGFRPMRAYRLNSGERYALNKKPPRGET
jgi:hypothetical protein